MSTTDEIWQWFGAVLAVLLTAVVINALIQRFSGVVQYLSGNLLQSALVIIIPSGIGILLYIWYDSGF